MERSGFGFDFNFNDVAIFVEVAKQCSISRTAELTGVPASTLSRRLSVLEDRLGMRLLSRTTRRIALTEAGRLYFERCRNLIEQALDAQDVLRDHGMRPRGTLKILLPDPLGIVRLPAFMVQFARTWPELQFRCSYRRGRRWEHDGDFDVALRWGTQADSDLVARSVAQFEFRLYAAPGYLARQGCPAHPDDLRHHDCVYTDMCPELSCWTLHGGEQRLSVKPRPRLVVDDLDLAHRLACEGGGIVALPPSAACRAALEPVLPGWRLAPVSLYAMYATRTPPARVRVFVDALVEHAGAVADADRNDRVRSRPGQAPLSRVETWAA
ncbi:LysR family transcriptional regulator [Bordetella sp. 2513F-2]